MKHIIIGASAAGLSAAKEIRQLRPHDEILVITADSKVHSRCMLHHYLGHEKTKEQINFTDPKFFNENEIDCLWETKVAKVIPADNKVVLADGAEIGYDTLLIATGAEYVVPPIPNFGAAKNVYGFRDLIDAEKLDAIAQSGKRCVIVGSGLVGLDAAYALSHRGVSCSIVELADRISPLQLDKTAAMTYQELFEKAGCSFYLSNGVEGSVMDEGNQITSILLKNGQELPCDFVLVSAGVRPNIQCLAGSGVKTERTVTVDEYLNTNVENIWAAGDVTGIAGIWSCAVKQGEVAAKNMCGIKTVYDDRFAFKNTMHFFGLSTLSLGKDSGDTAGDVYIRECRNKYEKYIVNDDVLTFVLIQGDISNKGFLQELIKRKISLKGLKKPVYELSYGDFYCYNPANGTYEWPACPA